MLLLAESGSSKTSWRIIDGVVIDSVETKGINPFFATKDFIMNELEGSKLLDYQYKITKLIFFGSGCSHEDRNNYLRNIFQLFFSNAAEVEVEHDMLAACIALFGKQSGIACIIGTGSNSCVYQDARITQNVSALGYILGDEASGSYIGKEIVRNFIYKTLPSEIYQFVESEYRLNKEDIFDAVYKKELPNRFLASFSKVASQYRDHSFIQDVLHQGFDQFIRYHIICYPESFNLPIGFVGSIASVFERELKSAMAKHSLTVNRIDSNPVEALVKFYMN